jgi:hypothetical protein
MSTANSGGIDDPTGDAAGGASSSGTEAAGREELDIRASGEW